ncbi:MAG: RNA 2',3'-cyclic phosphodiesterase [bacterium]
MRLFVGMPVPAAGLPELTTALESEVPGVRSVPPGTWHVTLRFLGEVDDVDPVRAALRARLADARAAPGRVTGIGAFPDRRRARILWAGILAPGIDAIARRVISATAEFGDPPERHDFVAHVTLARLRDARDVSKFLTTRAGIEFGPAPLDTVVLFSSVLRSVGPAYEPVETYTLKPQPSSPRAGSP